jgi:ribonuclease J
VLYTGDFRANGRKPSAWLFDALPTNINKLICEGTTLSRNGYIAQTEKSLEKEILDSMRTHSGPVFVLMSSMNIDRIVTMYRAAIQSDRLFLVDTYLAEITSSIRHGIPNPIDFEKVRVFLTYQLDGKSNRYTLFNQYGSSKIRKATTAKSRFVMCVRTSMLNHLVSLSKMMSFENGVLIYSFWSGYLKKLEVQSFIEECERIGLNVVNHHTSGHADENALVRLIEKVNPTRIIPVHTENAEWFSKKYPDKT